MNLKTIFNILIFSLILHSCKENEPKPDQKPVNESELITTMVLVLTDSATQNSDSFVFKDTDGDGGNPPSQFDSIRLKPNSAYSCSILLLDESKSTTDSISNAVKDEANDHLFVFSTTVSGLQISILDKDGNALPLGLKTRWRTGNNGSGKTRINLKHQAGIKNGNPDLGESDIDLEFFTRVE